MADNGQIGRFKLLKRSVRYRVHGLPVVNRHERRAAEAEAAKYGCDPVGDEHERGCPMYTFRETSK